MSDQFKTADDILDAYDSRIQARVDLYLKGWSTTSIAKHFEIPKSTVTKNIRSAGVMRSKSDAAKLERAKKIFNIEETV